MAIKAALWPTQLPILQMKETDLLETSKFKRIKSLTPFANAIQKKGEKASRPLLFSFQ